MSKIEAGRLRIHREVFDVGAERGGGAGLHPARAAAKSTALSRADIAVSTAIYADRLRLEQILYNLLSNAVKFTPDGGKFAWSRRSFARGS